MIVRVRSRLRWIASLPEPERTWAKMGIPEADWPQYSRWIDEALRLMGIERGR